MGWAPFTVSPAISRKQAVEGHPFMDEQGAMRAFIMKVGRGEKLAKPLTREEARQAMRMILDGSCSEFQIGAFFAAMRMKSETGEEIAGFAEALKEHTPPLHPRVANLMDFGDPYDGKTKSLNLSPLVALILASCSLPVVLHGEPDIPAKHGVGAGEVFTALGAHLLTACDGMARALEEMGLAFIQASLLLPRLAALKPLRQQYGLRSSLNAVEKMWNPSGARTLVTGIYHAPYFRPTAEALLALEVPHGFVVQGVEGFGELWLHRPTKFMEARAGRVEEHIIVPQDLGFATRASWESEHARDAKAQAQWTERVLAGERGPAHDGACLNAGVKLFWAGQASSAEEGIAMAREKLEAGDALRKLREFVKWTGGSYEGS
jgi:anthranilate phosphoribosyltransferase